MNGSADDGKRVPGITRRDFLDGTSLAIGGMLAPGPLFAGASTAPPASFPYPPALTGLRGNHDGSQTYPHAVRDGALHPSENDARDTGERYDLVVVGAGLSGLSAAYVYRQKFGPAARILILDNHDDFGGHARRNEFDVDGRLLLSYGGTQAIDNPRHYRPRAKQLLAEIGVDILKVGRHYDRSAYAGLGTACFFDRETFGRDALVDRMGSTPWPDFLARAPLSERARSDLTRAYTDMKDPLAHLSRQEKRALLARMSYADYLVQHLGVDRASLPFLQSYSHDLFGVGIDAVSALACYENPDDYDSFTYPGFQALGLEPLEREPYIYMFPDGNATIARLLVRSLIPDSVPGTHPSDVVLSKARYDRLDVDGRPVRLRLNSPAVRVARQADGVFVDYASGSDLRRVRARHCVLACYNAMIPYLVPQLPAAQKEALHYAAKAPFLYTHVALRRWHSFRTLGVRQIVSPGAYHSYTALGFPVSGGGYACARHPDEPVALFMLRAPCQPGLSRRDQHRAGRAELLATPYAAIEASVRDQLQRMLGPAGFDGDADIAGITVNRWAHGYAYEYDSLFDPAWPAGRAPHEIGRQAFGPIAIANSDAAASAYTDAAIDQAYRAVGNLASATSG